MSKLMEKENKFYKECGIVMLKNWDTKSGISITGNGILLKSNDGNHNCYINIYITSDDEIKENDWCYDKRPNEKGNLIDLVYQKKIGPEFMTSSTEKKIIGTTDTSLNSGLENGKLYQIEAIGTKYEPTIIPQPSDKFIQSYIEAYNKGEKIEKVLVEYEKGNFRPDGSQGYFEEGAFTFEWLLKLKDNSIIIKKVKDSWTREEVIALIKKFNLRLNDQVWLSSDDRWVEENL